MTEYMPIIWLLVAVIMAVVEVCTSQLVSVWFIVGAVSAAICSATFLDSIFWQIVVFIVVSAVALILTRPVVRKIRKFDKVKTNSDRNIGKTAVVIIDIDPVKATGMVEVEGTKWTARSTDGGIIVADTTVVVDSIEGVKLMVSKLDKK